MSKIRNRNLSSSKIVQNLLQSFVFKTREFEDCGQSLFRSKICERSGICDYSSDEAREPRAACCAGAYCVAKLTSMTQNELQLKWWQIRRLIVFVVISRFSFIYRGTLKLLG